MVHSKNINLIEKLIQKKRFYKIKSTSIYVKAIEKLGGVDGILGFSQGTRIVQDIFTEIQLGTSKIKKENRPTFAIFIGGWINFNNVIINYPSLH